MVLALFRVDAALGPQEACDVLRKLGATLWNICIKAIPHEEGIGDWLALMRNHAADMLLTGWTDDSAERDMEMLKVCDVVIAT